MPRAYLTFIIAAACVVAALTGCGSQPEQVDEPKLPAPAAAVEGLLDLRFEGSADASAYAEFLASEALAASAAEEDSKREGDEAPIPEWETPKVTQEGTSTAEVTVVWKPSAEDTAWPETTVFVLELIDGSWKIVDAAE